jgi:PqqD family protein of HPr-rel-A system
MSRFHRNPSVEAAPLQQELMLFNAATKKFCVLNATAAHIWERLDEPRTADELVVSLREQFAANGQAIEQDVEAVLAQLESLDLVTRAV